MSDKKMRSNSPSEFKIWWVMSSSEVKGLFIAECLALLGLGSIIVSMEIYGVNPDITLEVVAKECAIYAVIMAMVCVVFMFHTMIRNQVKIDRKKKGFKPTWQEEDLDILEDEMLQLEARIKKLEERRY